MFKYLMIVYLAALPFAEAVAQTAVIKSTANRDDFITGDYWFGEDFAAGFARNGYETTVDYRGEYQRAHEPEPDLNIYMRGYTKFEPPLGKGINVLYAYYPMAYHHESGGKRDKAWLNARETVPESASLDDDWQNFDIIAVASMTFADELRQHGINAMYVPQFTNPERFYPAPDDRLKTDILFVGSNWHDRTSLRFALENGFDVSVYGFNWDGVVPKRMYKGWFASNPELYRYYSSAKIVLNDHRPDMKKFGFVNNRIYDATACGALVISDYMPEIEAAYGDSVPMYKNSEELAELLRYYLSHEDERREKAARARAITLEKFTSEGVARTIARAVKL